MIKIIFAFVFSILSTLSFAQENRETDNQKITEQIFAALNSQEVQAILKSEDGFGNIKTIEYFQPTRMNPEVSRIEITFLSFGPQGHQLCSVNIFVNSASNTVEDFNHMPCVKQSDYLR